MIQTITLAGGCFWCLEAVFRQLRGVESVVSGYTGGHLPHPAYRQVCGGDTGHAEAVRVVFDEAGISLRDLLAVFFASHDPTTPNRQGHDIGTQYRSAIFYHDAAQKAVAEQCIAGLEAARIWPARIVTQVVPAAEFYPAEACHQDYYAHNPHQPYCQAVVAPKLAHVRRLFADKFRAVGSADAA